MQNVNKRKFIHKVSEIPEMTYVTRRLSGMILSLM